MTSAEFQIIFWFFFFVCAPYILGSFIGRLLGLNERGRVTLSSFFLGVAFICAVFSVAGWHNAYMFIDTERGIFPPLVFIGCYLVAPLVIMPMMVYPVSQMLHGMADSVISNFFHDDK